MNSARIFAPLLFILFGGIGTGLYIANERPDLPTLIVATGLWLLGFGLAAIAFKKIRP